MFFAGTILTALAWIVVVLTTFLAIPRSAFFARLTIAVVGIMTVGLIFITASGIHKAIHITKMLNEIPAGSAPSVQSTPSDQTEAVIYVHADDTITLDGDKILPSELDAALKSRMHTEPHLVIALKCDDNTSYSFVKAVVDICEKVPVKNIVLEVSEE